MQGQDHPRRIQRRRPVRVLHGRAAAGHAVLVADGQRHPGARPRRPEEARQRGPPHAAPRRLPNGGCARRQAGRAHQEVRLHVPPQRRRAPARGVRARQRAGPDADDQVADAKGLHGGDQEHAHRKDVRRRAGAARLRPQLPAAPRARHPRHGKPLHHAARQRRVQQPAVLAVRAVPGPDAALVQDVHHRRGHRPGPRDLVRGPPGGAPHVPRRGVGHLDPAVRHARHLERQVAPLDPDRARRRLLQELQRPLRQRAGERDGPPHDRVREAEPGVRPHWHQGEPDGGQGQRRGRCSQGVCPARPDQGRARSHEGGGLEPERPPVLHATVRRVPPPEASSGCRYGLASVWALRQPQEPHRL
mmetsp:Transcript_15729/g.39559  ORF Transcript_15729/g.39559 Transcript_15729/m.39559 type:complete len:360 (-) Transcript_15729:88-1167(-)